MVLEVETSGECKEHKPDKSTERQRSAFVEGSWKQNHHSFNIGEKKYTGKKLHTA